MTTFGDLVEQTKSLLHSYTGVHEQVTWLTADCDSAVTALAVDNSTAVSRGISEIGQELIYVSVSGSGVLTLAPFGRGYKGSTAGAHLINDLVMFDPAFPTVEIKRALNQCLSAVYPQLYQIKTTTFTFGGAVAAYELPSDVERVLKVTWEPSGPSLYQATLSRWEYDPNGNFTSGKSIYLHEAPEQGALVKVAYQAPFTQFAVDADTLATVGLPESALDLLLYGATSKLIRFLEPARLQAHSVENMSRAQLMAPGDPGKVANQLYAMYQTRLAEELKKLLENNPPQLFFTR